MKVKATLFIVVFMMAALATPNAHAAQANPDKSPVKTEKIKGFKTEKADCEFEMRGQLESGFKGIVEVDFTWDDPRLVNMAILLGIEPVSNLIQPTQFDKMMEKSRKENQANCVAFLNKKVTQSPTQDEENRPPGTESREEVPETSPDFSQVGYVPLGSSVKPKTVFPVRRGGPSSNMFAASGSSLAWLETWFEDPIHIDVNKVITWARWSWNPFTAYNGSGGDYRWWLKESYWTEVGHEVRGSWVQGGQAWYYNVNTWDYFQNRSFCLPNSYDNPTRVVYGENRVIGGPNGAMYYVNRYYWNGTCWEWLHPHWRYGVS